MRDASKPIVSSTMLGAVDERRRRAPRAPRRARPPRPRPGRSRKGASSSSAARRASSSSTAAGPAPFCGPKTRAAPRSPSSGLRTSQSTRTGSVAEPRADDGTHRGAAVDGRRPADADEHRRRALGQRGEQQLAEPGARRAQRIALVLGEQRQPDRLGRLDHRRAVVAAAASWAEPAARAHRRRSRCATSPPSAASITAAVPFAAVGDRQLVARRGRGRGACPAASSDAASRARGRP